MTLTQCGQKTSTSARCGQCGLEESNSLHIVSVKSYFSKSCVYDELQCYKDFIHWNSISGPAFTFLFWRKLMKVGSPGEEGRERGADGDITKL